MRPGRGELLMAGIEIRRFVLCLLLLVIAAPAAAQSCSFSITTTSFGTVDVLSGAHTTSLRH
jgi:hypothetical protein